MNIKSSPGTATVQIAEIETSEEDLTERSKWLAENHEIVGDENDVPITNIRAELHDVWADFLNDEMTRQALRQDGIDPAILEAMPKNPFRVHRLGNNSGEGLMIVELLLDAVQTGALEAAEEIVKATMVTLWTRYVLRQLEHSGRQIDTTDATDTAPKTPDPDRRA